MDRNERNTMDQNARKRTVRREGNAAGSTRANEGLGRRPSGNGAPASAGRPSGKSSSASVRRTSESGDPTRRTTPGGTVTPMRRESGSVRKPSEQAGRAQGSLRKEHSETGRTRDTAGVPTDPSLRRTSGKAGTPTDPSARRTAGKAGTPADPSLRRAAGKAQGNPAEQKPVRSADGIVRKQGGHPNGKSKAMSKKKKKQKRAAFNFASGGVLIIAACVFIFSLYQLITMLIPYYSGGEEYDKIKNIAITADEEGKGFTVDFDALLKENEDTVAWIRFDEPAVINYPVVKSADNNEYLTKTFTANDNKLGAIFVDMRNSNDFSDKNTFIYGHHLNVGGEMFSELLKYENESFCKKHPNFYIYTPDGKVRTYKVFSAGVVKDTADNYKLDYATDADYEAYLKLCEESSNYKVEDVELTAQSQIVSLSTCTNVRDDERFLVQGVLTAVD
ncbi:class B sortase [[Ruminococcus] torques]|uniref:class B sortase n=2 Tax=[Ruminococcus] torques TaxID=33039 RepID=UPI002ED43B74